MIRDYVGLGMSLAGAAVLAIALWVAYNWAHDRGAAEERLVCDADYKPKMDELDTLKDEKLQMQQLALQLQRDREAKEAALRREAQEKVDELTAQLKAAEAAGAGARRERDRLRAAIETIRLANRHLVESANSAPGPPADGRGRDAWELLGECATELEAMGRRADSVLAKVVGLQAYARLAYRACGS